MAIKICNEILKCPFSPEIRVYTKSLSSLELSNSLAKDLLVLLNEILEVKYFLITLMYIFYQSRIYIVNIKLYMLVFCDFAHLR